MKYDKRFLAQMNFPPHRLRIAMPPSHLDFKIKATTLCRSALCVHAISVSALLFCSPSISQTMIYDTNDPALVTSLRGKAAGVVGISSVADAASTATQAQRRTLIIVGHGESGTIGMGAGESAGYSQGQDLKYDRLADVQTELQTLSTRYHQPELQNPTANSNLLILCACESGDDTNGAMLVRNLSNIFPGTYVVASKIPTTVGSWQQGNLCAWQAARGGNPTRWTARASTIGFNGAIVNDTGTSTEVIGLVNQRVCVPCDNARLCPVKKVNVRVLGCG